METDDPRRALWHRWRDLHEYSGGALWVLPTVCGVLALAAGWVLSRIDIAENAPYAWLAFQGTADDARSLLTTIATTIVAVIATVLGLAVVALQLSSTQFSPRLVRNFLRDGVTQRVLSVFAATFAYSAAGLYTVGVSEGGRVEDFPRLAVSGALVLLFFSLGAVVRFADHLTHSLQVDNIMGVAARNTLRTAETTRETTDERPPQRPDWAVPLVAARSGYIQTLSPGGLIRLAARADLTVALTHRIGDYLVGGTTVAWMWGRTAAAALPDPAVVQRAVADAVDVGFERTLQQDVGFGIRQLTDSACKALSPAVNDPYTAVQAVHHLTDVFVALARKRLGTHVLHQSGRGGAVVVPGRRFGDYLASAVGQIRRYGASEPTVAAALLELMSTCADVAGRDDHRSEALASEAALVLADAERLIAQPADLRTVHAAYAGLQEALAR